MTVGLETLLKTKKGNQPIMHNIRDIFHSINLLSQPSELHAVFEALREPPREEPSPDVVRELLTSPPPFLRAQR